MLQSSELYCRTYNLLLARNQAQAQAQAAQPKDNGALLQLLAQRGVVAKDQDSPVTDADLRHKPIKMVMLLPGLVRLGACCSPAVRCPDHWKHFKGILLANNPTAAILLSGGGQCPE